MTAGEPQIPSAADEAIADRFAGFCGEVEFRRFVTDVNTVSSDGELRGWQKILWRRFVATDPSGIPSSCDRVFAICRICHLHWRRLEPDRVPVSFGLPAPERMGQWMRWPFARLEVWGGCFIGGPQAAQGESGSRFRAWWSRWLGGRKPTPGRARGDGLEAVFFCQECRVEVLRERALAQGGDAPDAARDG